MYNVNNNLAINSNTSEERLTAETLSTDELKLSKLLSNLMNILLIQQTRRTIRYYVPGIWSELLLSFSMKANVLQILDQSVGADTVPVVHGLRSLSMVWVIFGHTCIVIFKVSIIFNLHR